MITLAFLLAFISASLSVAEIDEICTGWSGAVEVIAKDRDKGVEIEEWLARLYILYESQRISYETYGRSVGFVEIIYANPATAPDALAFMAKDSCVDFYMVVEEI